MTTRAPCALTRLHRGAAGAFAIHSFNASFTRTYFFITLFFIVVQSLPGFYGLVKLFLAWPAAALFVSIAFIISYGQRACQHSCH